MFHFKIIQINENKENFGKYKCKKPSEAVYKVMKKMDNNKHIHSMKVINNTTKKIYYYNNVQHMIEQKGGYIQIPRIFRTMIDVLRSNEKFQQFQLYRDTKNSDEKLIKVFTSDTINIFYNSNEISLRDLVDIYCKFLEGIEVRFTILNQDKNLDNFKGIPSIEKMENINEAFRQKIQAKNSSEMKGYVTTTNLSRYNKIITPLSKAISNKININSIIDFALENFKSKGFFNINENTTQQMLIETLIGINQKIEELLGVKTNIRSANNLKNVDNQGFSKTKKIVNNEEELKNSKGDTNEEKYFNLIYNQLSSENQKLYCKYVGPILYKLVGKDVCKILSQTKTLKNLYNKQIKEGTIDLSQVIARNREYVKSIIEPNLIIIAKLLYLTDNFKEDANYLNKLLDFIDEKFIKSDTYNRLEVANQQKYNEINQELDTIHELVSYGRINEIYTYEEYLKKTGRASFENNKTRFSFNNNPIELVYYLFNLIFEQEKNYQTIINKVDESPSLYQSGEVEKNNLIELIKKLFNSKDKLEYFITNFIINYKKKRDFLFSILIKNKKLGLENIYFDDIYKNNFILLRNDIYLIKNEKIPYLINVTEVYIITGYLKNYNQSDLNDYIQKNLNETTLFGIYFVLILVHYNNIPYQVQFNIEYFINFIKTNKIAPYKNNIFNNFEQYFNKIDFSFDENKKIFFLNFFELIINKNFEKYLTNIVNKINTEIQRSYVNYLESENDPKFIFLKSLTKLLSNFTMIYTLNKEKYTDFQIDNFRCNNDNKCHPTDIERLQAFDEYKIVFIMYNLFVNGDDKQKLLDRFDNLSTVNVIGDERERQELKEKKITNEEYERKLNEKKDMYKKIYDELYLNINFSFNILNNKNNTMINNFFYMNEKFSISDKPQLIFRFYSFLLNYIFSIFLISKFNSKIVSEFDQPQILDRRFIGLVENKTSLDIVKFIMDENQDLQLQNYIEMMFKDLNKSMNFGIAINQVTLEKFFDIYYEFKNLVYFYYRKEYKTQLENLENKINKYFENNQQYENLLNTLSGAEIKLFNVYYSKNTVYYSKNTVYNSSNMTEIIEYFQSNDITQTKFKFIYFELLIKHNDPTKINENIVKVNNELNKFDIFNKDYIEYLQIYLEFPDKFRDDKTFEINELLKIIITNIDGYQLSLLEPYLQILNILYLITQKTIILNLLNQTTSDNILIEIIKKIIEKLKGVAMNKEYKLNVIRDNIVKYFGNLIDMKNMQNMNIGKKPPQLSPSVPPEQSLSKQGVQTVLNQGPVQEEKVDELP